MCTDASIPPAVWKRCYKMAIKLLDDRLINKIAAGEVIERPASIVKELVENAIDAGSTKINVNVSGGGIDRIEITDNGSGIPYEDVPLAFKRHATSKITIEADLFNIDTMGFRGEALPSIASVSRLELYTQYETQTGVRAILEGGREPELEAHPTAPGTRIIVRDLFFNTPARRKFLKSAVSEGIHIHDIMSRLALSRSDISFSFANEKKLYFKTPGSGNLLDTVISIYGRDYASNFLDMEWSGADYSLYGLISKPEFTRVNRKNQTFFVNHRWVKSQMLARAVEEAYRGRLLSREYPAVFLFLEVPKAEVDVNVHPQKAEVRFRDEKVIFRLISHGIRERLDNSGSISAAAGEIRSALKPWPDQVSAPLLYQGLTKTSDNYVNESALNWENNIPAHEILPYRGLDSVELPMGDSGFGIVGQCFDSYILVENGEELWLVDQHAAHERIMYNRLVEKNDETASNSQMLMFPLAFDVSSAHMDLLEAKQAIFREIGFDIEALGPNSAIIRSAPPLLQGREIEVINECLELWEDERPIDIKNQILAMMACKQAIKAGQSLSRQEMAMLINDLLQEKDFKNCPHGRPTMVAINHMELDKRFKRK